MLNFNEILILLFNRYAFNLFLWDIFYILKNKKKFYLLKSSEVKLIFNKEFFQFGIKFMIICMVSNLDAHYTSFGKLDPSTMENSYYIN